MAARLGVAGRTWPGGRPERVRNHARARPGRAGPRRRCLSTSGAGARAYGPDLRHHRLPAAVPRRGASDGHRADRRHAGRAQLRAWRQWLVAVVGLGRDRRAEGHGLKPQGRGGAGLRRARPDLGDPGSEGRGQGHDLRPRVPAADPVGAGDRKLDAGLPDRAGGRGRAGLRPDLGADGPRLVQGVPQLPGPAGRAGAVDRPLHCQ